MSGDLLTLGLYLMQQLGIMLGVGAATIVLVAHLVSARDGIVNATEARFARTIERVLMVGLLLIISSGIAITALHLFAGQFNIIFSSAYLFKWLLIGIVTLPLIVGHAHPFQPVLYEGFIGATWYALFVLHIVAPIASWLDLLVLYAAWVIVFLLLWSALARLFHIGQATAARQKPALALSTPNTAPVVSAAKKTVVPVVQKVKPFIKSVMALPMPTITLPVITPKPIPPPSKPTPPTFKAEPVLPKPAPLPQPVPKKPPAPKATALPVPHKPAPVVPVKPPTKPAEPQMHFTLPAIRIMPRTQEDVDNQLREDNVTI